MLAIHATSTRFCAFCRTRDGHAEAGNRPDGSRGGVHTRVVGQQRVSGAARIARVLVRRARAHVAVAVLACAGEWHSSAYRVWFEIRLSGSR